MDYSQDDFEVNTDDIERRPSAVTFRGQRIGEINRFGDFFLDTLNDTQVLMTPKQVMHLYKFLTLIFQKVYGE